jgi:holo-[acyl-carrier protein] synthase
MITGIGVDLIEVARVTKACDKESFLRRYFTEKEIELISKDIKKAADNFAVKEAVSKVLGTGFRTFFPIDIEVLRNPDGKPFVKLYGKAEELATEQGITAIHVSISNTKEYATAFAVGEKLHDKSEADI